MSGIIKALFLNMGKVLPYFKMTPELAQQVSKNLAKVMMYVKSKGLELTKKQKSYISDQAKQLELYEKSITPSAVKGPKATVTDITERLGPEAPYSTKNPKGWMPSETEEAASQGRGIMTEMGFSQNLVDDTINLLKDKDVKSMSNELKKLMLREGTYADYSERERKAVLDGIQKIMESRGGYLDFATGGRVGLSKGLVEMMIKTILKNKNLVQEFFSVRPDQVTREALERMASRNMAGLKKTYNLIVDKIGMGTKVPEQVSLNKILRSEGVKFNKHVDDTMDNFFQRSGDIKYDADALTDSFFEGIGSTVDDVALKDRLKVYDAFYKKLAKQQYGDIMRKRAAKNMYEQAAQREMDAMEAAADVGMKEPMGLTNEQIYAKYQDKISDDLLKKIVIDDNPQRRAEVMATLDEALLMMDKGMDKDQILNIIKNTTRTKNASGGLNYLMGL